MKFSNPQYYTFVLISVLIVALLVTGCQNPANDDNHDEHEHAEGAVMKIDEVEIVRIEGGEVQSGQIEVSKGEETPLITIYFLAEDGDEFQPDEPDYTLRWDQIDESVAEVQQHNEDGKWSFHVHGLSAGNTTVRFQLWHEGENHSDFDTPEIDVIVN